MGISLAIVFVNMVILTFLDNYLTAMITAMFFYDMGVQACQVFLYLLFLKPFFINIYICIYRSTNLQLGLQSTTYLQSTSEIEESSKQHLHGTLCSLPFSLPSPLSLILQSFPSPFFPPIFFFGCTFSNFHFQVTMFCGGAIGSAVGSWAYLLYLYYRFFSCSFFVR